MSGIAGMESVEGWAEAAPVAAEAVATTTALAVAQARFTTLDAMGMDDPAEGGGGLAMLDIIEALGAHFHEHQADVLRWPWKLFCAKWRRMMVQLARREAERERDRLLRDVEQQQRDAEQELQRAHQQHWGG